MDIDNKIVRASVALGAFEKAVFLDNSLSRLTKKIVYLAVILGVLLFVAKKWPANQNDIMRYEGFYQSVFVISRMQQRL